MSHSSLVDLKAELLRKQQELKARKLQNASNLTKPTPAEKKSTIWSKKNAGVLERAQRDLEAKKETDDILGRSQAALLAKTRLYEQMTQANTVPDEDGSKRFLVDFEKKAIDTVLEKREKLRKQEDEEKKRQKEEEEEKKLLKEEVPTPDDPEEEWVDYTDALGRSRRCMKKDLPGLKKMDKRLAPASSDNTGDTPKPDLSSEPHLMSNDMYREKMREKWEQEAQEALEKPVGPVHYADVQHDEIRAHGVAYYQFDKDEERRRQEMESLKKMREQTLEMRSKNEKLKEKRKAMMKERLAKVRRRKLIREGKNPDEFPPEEEKEDSGDEMIGPKVSEQKEPELLVREDDWRKDAPLRDWDKGKDFQEFKGAEDWLKERRDERVEDFAPPQFYYDAPKKGKGTNERDKEFGPPSEYEAECRTAKRPAQDTQEAPSLKIPKSETENVTDTVSKGISSIREELENKSDKPASDNVNHTETNTGDTRPTDNPAPGYNQSSDSYNDSYYRAYAEYYAQWQQYYQGMQQPMYPGQAPPQYGPGLGPYGPGPMQGPYGPMPPGPPMGPHTGPFGPMPGGPYGPPPSNPPGGPFGPPPFVPPGGPFGPPPPIPPGGYYGHPPSAGPYGPGPWGAVGPGAAPPPQALRSSQPAEPITSSSSNQASTDFKSGSTNEPLLPPGESSVPVSSTVQNTAPPPQQEQSEKGSSADTSEKSTEKEAALVKLTSEPQSSSAAAQQGAPQPAHYSAGPSKPQTVRRPYQRVNLHELPSQLPAPPTAGNIPDYPSQEMVFGPSTSKEPRKEKDKIKFWQRQFQYHNTGVQKADSNDLKTANIPFPAPHVQKKDVESEVFPEVDFDPSKPPPNLQK